MYVNFMQTELFSHGNLPNHNYTINLQHNLRHSRRNPLNSVRNESQSSGPKEAHIKPPVLLYQNE